MTPPDPHIIRQRHNLVCEGAANCIFVDNSSALLQSYCVLLQWPLLHNDLTVWLKLSSTINACMISLTTLVEPGWGKKGENELLKWTMMSLKRPMVQIQGLIKASGVIIASECWPPHIRSNMHLRQGVWVDWACFHSIKEALRHDFNGIMTSIAFHFSRFSHCTD